MYLDTSSIRKRLTGNNSLIYSLVVLRNGDLSNSSLNKSIIIWNLNAGKIISKLLGHTYAVGSFKLLSNGDWQIVQMISQ